MRPPTLARIHSQPRPDHGGEPDGHHDRLANSSLTGNTTVDRRPRAGEPSGDHQPALTLIAGTMGQATVELEDTYGNQGATSTSTQTIDLITTSTVGAFYATQGSTTPISSVDITAGQAASSFDYGDTKAGMPTITLSDTALGSSPTQVETIYPRAIDQIVVTTNFANPDVAGTPGTVTVTARTSSPMSSAAAPTGSLGTVDLSSTDRQTAGLPPSYTFTSTDWERTLSTMSS